ncbi:MAG: zinc-ribbon domain-containing protein [Oscillospiraceae bacterium]|nr:zinc-ribbon domain-containing protein [Oscillospiraceae bacterium]
MKNHRRYENGFFDKVGRAFSATSQSAVQKTRELADIARLNGQIMENNERIARLYREIGELYCKAHPDDAEPAYARHVAAVQKMQRQNEEWNDQIQLLRGMTKCPQCGEYVAGNAPFCTACGHRLLPETAVVCPGCGAVADRGALFCENCGTRLPESPPEQARQRRKVCHLCGAELEDGALFCSNCGVRRPSPDSPGAGERPAANPAEGGADVRREEPPSFQGAGDPVYTPPDREEGDDPDGGDQEPNGDIQPPERAVSGRRCPHCGAKQTEDTIFCAECGAMLY